jgi:hypothetical protein
MTMAMAMAMTWIELDGEQAGWLQAPHHLFTGAHGIPLAVTLPGWPQRRTL